MTAYSHRPKAAADTYSTDHTHSTEDLIGRQHDKLVLGTEDIPLPGGDKYLENIPQSKMHQICSAVVLLQKLLTARTQEGGTPLDVKSGHSALCKVFAQMDNSLNLPLEM